MYFKSLNFGDNLNSFILSSITCRKIKYYTTKKIKENDFGNIKKLDEISKTDIFFIGSILANLCDWSFSFKKLSNRSIISKWYFKIYDYFHPLIIFGSGFIKNDSKTDSYMRNLKIIAVRGNITLQRLKRNGIKVDNNIVLADPGILSPFLIQMNNKNINQQNYELCVIPHRIEQGSQLIHKNIKLNQFNILNVLENPIKFIKSLTQCKRVLSSSLHGLIVSDSLGIPNMRIILSNKIIGGNYKFIDYYSAFNLELPFSFDLRKNNFTQNDLTLIDINHNISKDLIFRKQCQLLKNFPFKLNKQFIFIKNIKCKNKF